MHRSNDVFEIEAIAPLLVLVDLPTVLESLVSLHFVDNSVALSSLVRGNSSVQSDDVIVGETWKRVLARNTRPWLDRVDSKSHPVVGLSRGVLHHGHLQFFRFPNKVLQQWMIGELKLVMLVQCYLIRGILRSLLVQ